jgi:hypothetical protein
MRIAARVLGGMAAIFCPHTSIANAAWWWTTGTYEECLLEEMKGQAQSMYLAVVKVCSRRFGKEVGVGTSEFKYTWTRNTELKLDGKGHLIYDELTVKIKENNEYNITRLQVRLAPKACDKAEDGDFGEPVTVQVVNGEGTVSLGSAPVSTADKACAQLIGAWGKYK